MTQHGNFTLRAARDRAARGNGTTVHNSSRLAARHKTAAAGHGDNAGSRGWQHYLRRDRNGSAAEILAHPRGNTSILNQSITRSAGAWSSAGKIRSWKRSLRM